MFGCDLTFGLPQSKSRDLHRDRSRQFPVASRFDTVWADRGRFRECGSGIVTLPTANLNPMGDLRMRIAAAFDATRKQPIVAQVRLWLPRYDGKRRSVLTRSPGFLGISDAAHTMQSKPGKLPPTVTVTPRVSLHST